MTKRYRLKKDTFFYKAGTICRLTPKGNLAVNDNIGTCILHKKELKDHPELLDEWFEKIEGKKCGGRVPEKGDKYWFLAVDGTIQLSFWCGASCDEGRFEIGLAFWTYEEAEKELKRRKAYVILKEYTKGFEPTWGRDELKFKYYVLFDYFIKDLRVDSARYHMADRIYFATEEEALASIKAHRQEWLDYLGVKEEA